NFAKRTVRQFYCDTLRIRASQKSEILLVLARTPPACESTEHSKNSIVISAGGGSPQPSEFWRERFRRTPLWLRQSLSQKQCPVRRWHRARQPTVRRLF